MEPEKKVLSALIYELINDSWGQALYFDQLTATLNLVVPKPTNKNN